MRSSRLALAFALLTALVGCDSNPEGPSMTTDAPATTAPEAAPEGKGAPKPAQPEAGTGLTDY